MACASKTGCASKGRVVDLGDLLFCELFAAQHSRVPPLEPPTHPRGLLLLRRLCLRVLYQERHLRVREQVHAPLDVSGADKIIP